MSTLVLIDRVKAATTTVNSILTLSLHSSLLASLAHLNKKEKRVRKNIMHSKNYLRMQYSILVNR